MAGFPSDLFRYRRRGDVERNTQESISLDRKAVAYLHETSVRFLKHAAAENHC